jgi:NAD(P)-dependent dehydrogenase (short-subunit alcohol dehydrogenase family)
MTDVFEDRDAAIPLGDPSPLGAPSAAHDRRAAIVTGAGSGIGRAIALRFTALGINCVLNGRRPEPLKKTADLCATAPGDVEVVTGDVGDQEQRGELVHACVEVFGRIDVLVNNAGGSHALPLLDPDIQAWRAELATNLEAAAFLSTQAAEHMRSRGTGRIVNIGSVYGVQALDNAFYDEIYPAVTEDDRGPVRALAYAASKGGLLQLTRELAAAMGPWNITVNLVAPGMIAVESRVISPERRKLLESRTPLRRIGRPEDVAAAVEFLASAAAAFITGAELRVDGGWTVW